MTRKKISILAFLTVALMIIITGSVISEASVNDNRFLKISSDEFVTASPSMSSVDTEDSLDKVKKAIKEKGAKWQAGETSVSKLSAEDKAKMVGGNNLKLTTDTTPQAEPPVQALAPSLDWRNNNGNYVTPIKNQGSCGSCWAFAVTATAESANLIKNNSPYTQNPIDLSEQVVVSCSGAGSCSGGSPTTASSFLVSTGLPSESCYAYTATNGSCASACANWQASAYKIGNYVSIATDVTAIKNALASYGPISTVFSVYDDFYYYQGGVYTYTSGAYVGGHAVSIVGYDDATQSFLVKNSWGTGWGEAGYFRIAYSELNSVVGFGRSNLAYNTIVPDNTAPTVAITNPANNSNVSGTITISTNASDNIGIAKVELYVNNTLISTDTNAPYDFSWDSYSVPNGNATITVSAYDVAGNKTTSDPLILSVNNIPDTESPVVNITSPLNGANISSNTTISASASDNIAVKIMDCYIDNVKVATSNTGALTYSLNIKRMTVGQHSIKVTASDVAKNIGTSNIYINIASATKGRTR